MGAARAAAPFHVHSQGQVMNFGCRHADAMGCCWPKPPVLTCKLLPLTQVAVGILATDATTLFNAIGLAVAGPRGPRAEEVALRLARRHARKSVALGHGIALPRAAVPGLRCSTAVFMRMATPLAMNVPDGEPVIDVLCLLVPLPGFSSDWELLAGLIQQLGDLSLRGALRQAGNVESIHRLLTDSRQ